MPIVRMEGAGEIEFPDNMGKAVIEKALLKLNSFLGIGGPEQNPQGKTIAEAQAVRGPTAISSLSRDKQLKDEAEFFRKENFGGFPIDPGSLVGAAIKGPVKKLARDTASRLGRAKEQGFDTVAFHGGGDDITEFNLKIAKDLEGRRRNLGLGKGKIFLSGRPEPASGFAVSAPERGLGKSPNVMPLRVRGKFIDEDVYESRFKELSGGEPIFSSELTRQKRDSLITKLDKQVKSEGFDGIQKVHRDRDGNVAEIGQIAIFDPQNIRSEFAQFDPAKSKSANILAGVGAAFITGKEVINNTNEQVK